MLYTTSEIIPAYLYFFSYSQKKALSMPRKKEKNKNQHTAAGELKLAKYYKHYEIQRLKEFSQVVTWLEAMCTAASRKQEIGGSATVIVSNSMMIHLVRQPIL